jgi:hypothetical protein
VERLGLVNFLQLKANLRGDQYPAGCCAAGRVQRKKFLRQQKLFPLKFSPHVEIPVRNVLWSMTLPAADPSILRANDKIAPDRFKHHF